MGVGRYLGNNPSCLSSQKLKWGPTCTTSNTKSFQCYFPQAPTNKNSDVFVSKHSHELDTTNIGCMFCGISCQHPVTRTWYSALLMSIGLITVKAFFVLWLKDHGLSISAFNQKRMLPCFPSKDVAMPLKKQSTVNPERRESRLKLKANAVCEETVNLWTGFAQFLIDKEASTLTPSGVQSWS